MLRSGEGFLSQISPHKSAYRQESSLTRRAFVGTNKIRHTDGSEYPDLRTDGRRYRPFRR
jgi:hypothetical protein